jgi:hypothetical protein
MALPAGPKRQLLGRMIALSRALPQQFNQPLPMMMTQLTPLNESTNEPQSVANRERAKMSSSLQHEERKLTADDIRRLADAVAAWHLRSPLGICLRRSLLRYHFLREAKVPVRIVFGARLKDSQEGSGIGGHAWLTLNDAPYYENPADYAGFVVMYTYPVDEM